MLSIQGSSQRVCSGMTRRATLQAGGAGLLGLSVPQLLAAEHAESPFVNGRAKSVIFLYLFGGPSQLETWDMKPDAPIGLRGPFRPIASRTPDLRICEHMPRMAQLSDKFCVIRTMTHAHNDHNASHYMQTGHKFTRNVIIDSTDVNARDTDWPSMGSVVEYLSAHEPDARQRSFPDYVYLPNRLGHLHVPRYDRTGQYAGWLGAAYNGLATDVRPQNARENLFLRDCTEEELDFRIKGLVSRSEMSLDRLDRRRSLMDQFDGTRLALEQSRRYAAYDEFRNQALELVMSETIRTALDIRQESVETRDRYGRHLFGQSVLMGRRMIEAGARFVTVNWDSTFGTDGWDSHDSSNHLEKFLIPGFDQAFSALLGDLDERGLLDETLVVVVGEMGRAPKPDNPQWGRTHWSYCFPAILAGAGIRGGITYGQSDKDAAWPIDHPVSPEDLTATIYKTLGLDPALLSLPDPQQKRPVPIVDGGRPLDELFA
ncbi:MAG: DUF1501 domain-containing protein [Planctomycetaceae bacterium]